MPLADTENGLIRLDGASVLLHLILHDLGGEIEGVADPLMDEFPLFVGDAAEGELVVKIGLRSRPSLTLDHGRFDGDRVAGEDPFEPLEADGVSLIVLDVSLPDRNGFDLCKQIRKTSTVPIIFLTARASEANLRQWSARVCRH